MTHYGGLYRDDILLMNALVKFKIKKSKRGPNANKIIFIFFTLVDIILHLAIAIIIIIIIIEVGAFFNFLFFCGYRLFLQPNLQENTS